MCMHEAAFGIAETIFFIQTAVDMGVDVAAPGIILLTTGRH